MIKDFGKGALELTAKQKTAAKVSKVAKNVRGWFNFGSSIFDSIFEKTISVNTLTDIGKYTEKELSRTYVTTDTVYKTYNLHKNNEKSFMKDYKALLGTE